MAFSSSFNWDANFSEIIYFFCSASVASSTAEEWFCQSAVLLFKEAVSSGLITSVLLSTFSVAFWASSTLETTS